jgi:hypothetical protein
MPLQPAPIKSDPPRPASFRPSLQATGHRLPAPTVSWTLGTQVFENKIAAQLPLSNQMDSRQSNLSTTVSKQRLMQWNQILKHRRARPPIFEKTQISSLSPRHADPAFPSLEPPAPTVFEGQAPSTQPPGSQLTTHNSQLPAIHQKTKSLHNFYFGIKYITVAGHVDRLYTSKPQPSWNHIDRVSQPTPDQKEKKCVFQPEGPIRGRATSSRLGSHFQDWG